jgi:hypothetical protein
VTRKKTATKKRTRSNDREAEHAIKRMTPEDAWGAIKSGLDAETVAIVDGIMDGGFTWGDLLRLEIYEHMRVDKAIRYFLRKPWQASTLVHSLASVKLQCRKHARVGVHRDAAHRVRDAGGERHGMVKLTEEEVREIRASKLSSRLAAAHWGITDSVVRRIRRLELWSHIT